MLRGWPALIPYLSYSKPFTWYISHDKTVSWIISHVNTHQEWLKALQYEIN